MLKLQCAGELFLIKSITPKVKKTKKAETRGEFMARMNKMGDDWPLWRKALFSGRTLLKDKHKSGR